MMKDSCSKLYNFRLLLTENGQNLTDLILEEVQEKFERKINQWSASIQLDIQLSLYILRNLVNFRKILADRGPG